MAKLYLSIYIGKCEAAEFAETVVPIKLTINNTKVTFYITHPARLINSARALKSLDIYMQRHTRSIIYVCKNIWILLM